MADGLDGKLYNLTWTSTPMPDGSVHRRLVISLHRHLVEDGTEILITSDDRWFRVVESGPLAPDQRGFFGASIGAPS